ncbi:uncharacterized protein ARMOST_19901 [Armillaria ostoyae]|uniref:Uncharacterized protein n=1 Tax=Armillaria ostoyae TaxID=47428 RepID=A0A284S5V1_ARMOS|nr:uncharacterized protein ARMOST_19901 [Armillaria ostoyae]
MDIVNTSMLPASMVEEADLLTSTFTMSILMAVVNTPLNGLAVLARLEDATISRTRASKQPVAVKLDDDVNFFPPSLRLDTSTGPQDLMRGVGSDEAYGYKRSSMHSKMRLTDASPHGSPRPQMYDLFLPPAELLAQRLRWCSMDKTDTALMHCATACALLSRHPGSSRQDVGVEFGMQVDGKIGGLSSRWLAIRVVRCLECIFSIVDL